MQKYFTISINGQKAVDAGYAFCNGFCYRQIRTHGKALGQLEVVLDSDKIYNGFVQKWVTVSFIETGKDVERVLSALSKIGFSGCPCTIDESTEDGSFIEENTICCCII